MSFATQALQAEWVCKRAGRLEVKVHEVPLEIEERVCRLKLKAMAIAIDKLTPDQIAYLATSGEGT
jgi:adenosylhomocysteinase